MATKNYKLELRESDGGRDCIMCDGRPGKSELVIYLTMKLAGLKGMIAGKTPEPIHLSCTANFHYEIGLCLKDAERRLGLEKKDKADKKDEKTEKKA